jgi:endonuclease/exonuclease/phosphatase family metal-dependent hydrolase
LLKKPCVIIGDWNSNKIFDHIKRVGTHTEVVDFLKSGRIVSAYHTYFNEEHGQESIPTHIFRKDKSMPFHIDFLFASEIIITRLSHLEIGSFERWINFSDHVPICAVFKNE